MKKKNIMIGPDPSGAGGISSVIMQYKDNGLFSALNIEFWPSWQPISKFRKVTLIVAIVLKLIYGLSLRRINIVHIHSATNLSFLRKSIFARVANIFGASVIFHIHSGRFFDDYRNHSYFYRWWVKRTLSCCAAVVVLSESWYAEAKSILGESSSVYIIANPISFRLPPSFQRKQRTPETLNLLFLGALTREKGIFDLIKAVSNLRAKGLNVRVRCGGVGCEEARLRHLIRQNRLDDCFILLGWINTDQKIREFESADAFVLPSYYEGQPMAILEAMIARVLVISTTTGGIPDVISNGQNGLLVKAGDVAALEAVIEKLYHSSFFEEEMIAEAEQSVVRSHSPEIILKKIGELYERIELNNDN